MCSAAARSFLLATKRGGGVGCITATGNVNPGPIARLGRTWQQPDADEQQAALNATRAVFQKFPMIPALKAAIAHYANDPAWATVRPPLVELNEGERSALAQALQAAGFEMPGLGA